MIIQPIIDFAQYAKFSSIAILFSLILGVSLLSVLVTGSSAEAMPTRVIGTFVITSLSVLLLIFVVFSGYKSIATGSYGFLQLFSSHAVIILSLILSVILFRHFANGEDLSPAFGIAATVLTVLISLLLAGVISLIAWVATLK